MYNTATLNCLVNIREICEEKSTQVATGDDVPAVNLTASLGGVLHRRGGECSQGQGPTQRVHQMLS